jgi:hypothetical protein
MGSGATGANDAARVALGSCFLERIESERWNFGRGRDVLIAGLSTEEAFTVVIRLRQSRQSVDGPRPDVIRRWLK